MFKNIWHLEQSVITSRWFVTSTQGHPHVDDLVQDDSNSIANALELLQSCTKPSICEQQRLLPNKKNLMATDSPAMRPPRH